MLSRVWLAIKKPWFLYACRLVIDAYKINKDGFLLSLCLSGCSAAMGFFNVVVEESLSDANMTALTFLSVVFGTTESPTGIVLSTCMLSCSSLSFWYAAQSSTGCLGIRQAQITAQQQPDSHCLTAELLLPAITRVVGIIGGVLLSLLLSVLLWPKSASEQAMR